jgi:hypothetical protein
VLIKVSEGELPEKPDDLFEDDILALVAVEVLREYCLIVPSFVASTF